MVNLLAVVSALVCICCLVFEAFGSVGYIRAGFFGMRNVFWKYMNNCCATSGVIDELEKKLVCTHADNVQGTQLLVSIVLLNSDAVVRCLSILPWGVSSMGVDINFYLVCFSMRKVLLFCSYRVLQTGGPMLWSGMIYLVFVKMVLLILCEGFTSILLCVGFFPSCSYCLPLVWEIDTGMEIERFDTEIAVFTLAMIYDGIWGCRFTLAITRIFVGIWDLPFYLAFVIFVRDVLYLGPSSGAVCETAVIDIGLRRSGVSYRMYLGFSIVWRGIICESL